MTGKIAPKDNSSNMGNGNKGAPGTNKQYDQNQGTAAVRCRNRRRLRRRQKARSNGRERDEPG